MSNTAAIQTAPQPARGPSDYLISIVKDLTERVYNFEFLFNRIALECLISKLKSVDQNLDLT